MPNDVIHIDQIIEELQRIFEVELKSTLNLKSVMEGPIEFLPTPTIAELANGIWVSPYPDTTMRPSELPRQMEQVYAFRVVYVRRMAVGENPSKQSRADARIIINKLYDKFTLPDITNLPATAQILWLWVPRIEWSPPEDDLVARIAADLTATAFQIEVRVRTRRA